MTQGIHIRLSDGRDVIARMAKADVNMPRYDGWPIDWLHKQLEVEANIYKLLMKFKKIPSPDLLYFRRCEQQYGSRGEPPKDVIGRQLMIFDMAEGHCGVWRELSNHQKVRWLFNTRRLDRTRRFLPY